jgi:hypothetical protein
MKTHTHRESVKPTIPLLDDLVGPEDGLFVKPATIDAEVGEEVVIFLRDKAPKINEIIRLQTMLYVKSGVIRNFYGPLCWIIFRLVKQNKAETPIVSFLKYFNPHSRDEVAFWRRLADQDHWHLFLVVANEMRHYITYHTNFDLDKKLDEMLGECESSPMKDPGLAVKLFMKQNSAEDLWNLPEGRTREGLLLSKSDLEQMSEEEFVKMLLEPQSSGKKVLLPRD